MMNIAIYTVVSGALAGAAGWGLAGKRSDLLSFSMVGASGGALGLILYTIIRATVNEPLVFFWSGLSWILTGAMFAITILAFKQSLKNND